MRYIYALLVTSIAINANAAFLDPQTLENEYGNMLISKPTTPTDWFMMAGPTTSKVPKLILTSRQSNAIFIFECGKQTPITTRIGLPIDKNVNNLDVYIGNGDFPIRVKATDHVNPYTLFTVNTSDAEKMLKLLSTDRTMLGLSIYNKGKVIATFDEPTNKTLIGNSLDLCHSWRH